MSRASSSYTMVADMASTTSFASVVIACLTSSSFATVATTAGDVRRSRTATLSPYAIVADLALATSFAFVTITCPTISSFATATTTARGARCSWTARSTLAWSG